MQYYCLGIYALIGSFCLFQKATAQDSLHLIAANTSQFIDIVSSKSAQLRGRFDKKSKKALFRFKKNEERLKRKLLRLDSLAAKNAFADAGKKYEELEKRLSSNASGQYIPKLDTLVTSLKFLELNPQLLQQTKEVKEKLDKALANVKGLNNQFKKAEEIKKFLKERKQFLKD